MKKFSKKERSYIFVAVSLLIVVVILVVIFSIANNKPEVNMSSTTESETVESTTDTVTTESATELTINSTTETTKVESSTKEQTTRRKIETTTSNKGKVICTNIIGENMYQEDLDEYFEQFGGEQAYWARVEEVDNYPCEYCSQPHCPSLEYSDPDLLGNNIHNPVSFGEGCPAILNEELTCERCGKILTSLRSEDYFNYPEKNCDG